MKQFAASVASEILGHISENLERGERILKMLKNKEQEKIISASIIEDKLLIWHANDLLDQSTMKKGTMIASFAYGSIGNTISKLVPLVESIMANTRVKCMWELNAIQDIYLKFDKQRLQ